MTGPRRLFKADTPTDVAAAGLVVRTLPPGDDVLLLSRDKAIADTTTYADDMLAVAATTPWRAVVDITGMPLARSIMHADDDRSWRSAAPLVAASAAFVAERVADVLGVRARPSALRGSVDELYLTCLYHADVRLLARLFRPASISYVPHAFDSLAAAEIHQNSPWVGARPRTVRGMARDALTAVRWGRSAIDPGPMELAGAFSFHAAAPWAPTTSLRRHLDRATMRELFDALPAAARQHYTDLAATLPDDTALLLLPPDDPVPGYDMELDLACHAELGRTIVERESVGHLLLKPHPRASAPWIERLTEHLTAELPGVGLTLVSHHQHLPVEIVLAPFALRAIGGMSSSLRSLRMIYDVPVYFPESLYRTVWGFTPERRAMIDAWMAEMGDVWIRV